MCLMSHIQEPTQIFFCLPTPPHGHVASLLLCSSPKTTYTTEQIIFCKVATPPGGVCEILLVCKYQLKIKKENHALTSPSGIHFRHYWVMTKYKGMAGTIMCRCCTKKTDISPGLPLCHRPAFAPKLRCHHYITR